MVDLCDNCAIKLSSFAREGFRNAVIASIILIYHAPNELAAIETVQFYGNHVMLILNPVQEIQHNHHVMPDLIRHPHGTGIDPETSSG